MLSYQATGASHVGHLDPGLTTDWPSGSRWMTTFRKLPITAPKANATER
jgi:hypothetical protein